MSNQYQQTTERLAELAKNFPKPDDQAAGSLALIALNLAYIGDALHRISMSRALLEPRQ